MTYMPPKDILEVLQKIEYEEALDPDDPRYVDTTNARGSQKTLDRLARKFGLLLRTNSFLPPVSKYVLVFGHTGSGKTTELRHYARQLTGPDRFFIVNVDVTVVLDRTNLQYADALMAMAQQLLTQLVTAQVHVPPGALKELEAWFSERVLTSDQVKEFALQVETGAGAKTGLPFLIDVFAKFTAAFKANATYKDSLRHVIRNTFAQLATAFNALVSRSEEALQAAGRAKRILFIIDGTDKLRWDDSRQLFVFDGEQLLAIDALIIFTAPISLKYEGNLAGKLDSDLVLPMIKLSERDGSPFPDGKKAMKDILLRRVDPSVFSQHDECNRLVEFSGGHPRELLRLLKLCCEFAEGPKIDVATVDAAIAQLASEYRRFLEPDDYDLLARLDANDAHNGNDPRIRSLLYDLALLEYNDGAWRRSHPVIRTLEAYKRAAAALSPRKVP